MSNMENNYNFYIKNISDNSVWGVVKIDTTDENRLGWINCVCLNVGSNIDIYIGADMGIDADEVFLSGRYEFSRLNFE